MPSQLDNLAANDFPRAFTEAAQTVIRRIAGRADRTEEVEATVEFDSGPGLVDGPNGQYSELPGLMDIPVGQANLSSDTWVIDGEVFQQLGKAIGKDGGTKTVKLVKREGQRAREPRVTGK